MNGPAILLLGKNGQVGWELQQTLGGLGRVVALGRGEVDLTDAAALAGVVSRVRPALILNAAAYTAVDRAESEGELARKVNAVAPGVLAQAAQDVDARLIHFSTDYVFDGMARSPYRESDSPNPLNVYGRTKLAGEQAVLAVSMRHVVFRLSWVYGLRGNNFLLTMQRLARERPELRVVADQFGAPTWSHLVAEAMRPVVRRLLAPDAGAELGGVYHLSCGGQASWHEFASRILEAIPPSERVARFVTPISTADYPTPARRPAWSVLDCSKVARVFGVCLPGWDAALRAALEV